MSKHELTNFFFHNGSAEAKAIRVVTLNGEPWFHATDVCNALEIRHTPTAVSRIAAERKCCLNLHLPGRAPTFVSEAGLYDLILQSRKAEAREFKDWITGTVLPAIRKDGAYIMGEEKVATGEMDEEAFILKAYEMLKRKVERLAQEKEQLSMENKEMAPKAVVFDNCVALRQESLATFVRTLEGVNTMAIKGDLADLGYLYRTVGAGKYRVYAKYRNVLFTEKLIAHPTRPVYEILPTPEGKKLIVQLYRDGKLTMKKAYAAA